MGSDVLRGWGGVSGDVLGGSDRSRTGTRGSRSIRAVGRVGYADECGSDLLMLWYQKGKEGLHQTWDVDCQRTGQLGMSEG